MLDFDEILFGKINNINGFYQRYSDDLIIVCERQYEDEIIKILRDSISGDLIKLTIEPHKTKLYHFEVVNGLFKGYSVDATTKRPNSHKPLEYLGFSFDGQRVLIKNAGFSKFYRAMKGAFNRASSFAMHSKNPDKRIFKSKLYKRFTHKGAKRKLIYRPSKEDPKVYNPTKEYNWGNYLSYIYKADDAMHSINKNNAIKKQSRKIWSNFHKLMKIQEAKFGDN